MKSRKDDKAKEILSGLSDTEIDLVTKYISSKFVDDVTQGLDGEIEYKDSPFFEVIDKIYEDYKVKGCYFCDRGIDGNAVPFEYLVGETKLCMSCQLKVANLLRAFDITHDRFFPGVGERKIQKVLYGLEDE